MLDMNGFNERLEGLMYEMHLNKSQTSKIIGVSSATIADWRSGKGRPTLATAVKIAEFFGVSLDYLVYGGTKTEPVSANPADEAVLSRFNTLNDSCQKKVLAYMDGMIAASEAPESRIEKVG